MMFSHLERFEHPWLRGQIRPEFDPDRFNVEHTMGEADRLMELQRGLMPAFFENNTFILIDAICPGLRRLVRAFGVPVATAHFNPESLCYHSIRLTIHWPDNPYVKAAEVNDRKDEQLANWLGEPLSHLAQLREPALKLLILASDFPKFAEALRFLLNLSTFDCYYICDDSVNYVCWKRAALPTGTREPDRWERFSRYPNTLYEKSYPFPHVEISSFEVVGPQWCQQLKQISRVEKNRFLRTLQGMTGLGYSLHWHGDWTDQDIEKVSAVTAPACIWASVQDTCRFFSMRKLKIFADAILVEQQNWVEALSTYSLIGAIPFGCPVFRRFQHWPFTEEPSGMLAKTCTWNLLRDCEVMLQRLCSKAYNPRIQEIEVRPECCPFRLTMDLKPPTAYGIGGETSLRREPHIWSVALDHIKLLHKFNHISSRHEEATPAGHLRFLEFFHEVRRLRTYNAAYRGLVYPEYEDDYNHLSFFVDRHQVSIARSACLS